MIRMEQWFFNLIRKAEQMHLFSSILRLSLSILCGGILGIERGKANRSAGMRTYSLVCMSAALVMLTGEYMYEAFGTGDPARLGAQVVSGIGFLGAGSIIIEGNTKIRGLTTAAGLWSAACIGLAIGIGFYVGGVLATGAVYIVVTKFRGISDHFTHNDLWMRVYVEFHEVANIQEIRSAAQAFGIKVGNVILNEPKDGSVYNAVISLRLPEGCSSAQVVYDLEKMQGVCKVKQIY